jgi:hypothetical protein
MILFYNKLLSEFCSKTSSAIRSTTATLGNIVRSLLIKPSLNYNNRIYGRLYGYNQDLGWGVDGQIGQIKIFQIIQCILNLLKIDYSDRELSVCM